MLDRTDEQLSTKHIWYLCSINDTISFTVFTVFRLLTDFVCLYNYEFWLSLCKIVRSSVILLLPLFRAFLTIPEHLRSPRSFVDTWGHPSHLWGLLCSIASFLCSVLYLIVFLSLFCWSFTCLFYELQLLFTPLMKSRLDEGQDF